MTKSSWWSLKIEDYPNYKPNDVDLEHIAECIKEGYDNGQLIQEEDQEDEQAARTTAAEDLNDPRGLAGGLRLSGATSSKLQASSDKLQATGGKLDKVQKQDNIGLESEESMNTKEAIAITHTLSKPSKMPGFAIGIPAKECKTGAKLRKIKGSVCYGCYALKGCYVFPDVQAAQYKRLAAITNPLWVCLLYTSPSPRD